MPKPEFLKNACLVLVFGSLLATAKLQDQKSDNSSKAEIESPASVGLLLDNSKSMGRNRDAMVAAMRAFVQASDERDEFFVVNFSDSPYLDQDFTTDRRLIDKAIGSADSRGGSAFYDAAGSAAEHLRKSSRNKKRVLVVVSDGEDNESHVTFKFLLHELQTPGATTVFCIDVGDPGSRGGAVLDQLARQGGGVSFHVKKGKKIEQVVMEIAQEIRKRQPAQSSR
jgi:Ca-activated chloride channel homolog